MLNLCRKKFLSSTFGSFGSSSSNTRAFQGLFVKTFSTDQSQNSTALDRAENAFIDTSRKGSITFVVDHPLFPISKYHLQVSESKYKLLSRASPRYVSAVVRRHKDKEPIQEEQLKDNLAPVSVKDDFYKMGSYCTLDFNSQAFNTITLTALYRVEFDEIYRYKLPELSDNSDFEAGGRQAEHVEHEEPHHEIINDHEPEEEKPDVDANYDQGDLASQIASDKNISNREKRLRWLLEKTQKTIEDDESDPHTNIENKSILVSKIKPVIEPEFVLDIHREAKLKHIIDIYTKILYLNKSQIPLVNYNLKDAFRILDSLGSFIAGAKYFKADELQEAFELTELTARLDKMHSFLRKYYNFLEHFADLGQIAQQNINAKRAKEYYDEVFKIVKGAVEGDKGKNGIVEKFRAQMKEKKVPQHVMKVFEDEVKRFLSLDEMSSESNMIRSYLESIASIPFGVHTEDEYDLDRAKSVLDGDHYGLDDIKERILEFIAVGNMKKGLQGKILCLVGPPGVGKTSLAGSIAKALNRKYSRIALGGESDSSTLKGHRRTYIGAYPGKIVQALKECGSENCVILLDEIDKIGKSSYHGDPQSNLLEILDPSQNTSFTDNYLDFPIDLSKVLFICSANIMDTISAPLRDRMDIIELSSYTNEEKKHIFTNHLLPRAIEHSGLTNIHKFKIEDEVINKLVNEYAREAGVRSLERYTKKMLEKIAFQIVKRQDSQSAEEVVVNNQNLPKYIGHPKFPAGRFYKETPAGVVVGLAYTEYGGSLIYLEATQSSFANVHKIDNPAEAGGKVSGLKTTGSLGNVMKESMQIAYSYARSFAYDKLKNGYFEKNEVHIHAPEGATPKDGPSAGVTITTALLSLALQKPVKHNLGMTGEISLRGKVMKIGGVKEKILAAKRENITELIFPKSNEDDVNELKPYIIEGMTIHYAQTYDDVYKIAFEY